MTVYVGLDLTAGRRPSSLAVLDDAARLLAQGEALADADILAWAASYPAAVVAVDAPLGLPRGLCCLEPACACRPADPGAGRACERALSRLGFGCYYTTKRSIIKTMVTRAIALKAALEAAGHPVIEVYPHASRVRLFGKLPRKTTPAGRAATQRELMRLVLELPSPDDELLDHDALDAVLGGVHRLAARPGPGCAPGRPGRGAVVHPGVIQAPSPS